MKDSAAFWLASGVGIGVVFVIIAILVDKAWDWWEHRCADDKDCFCNFCSKKGY